MPLNNLHNYLSNLGYDFSPSKIKNYSNYDYFKYYEKNKNKKGFDLHEEVSINNNSGELTIDLHIGDSLYQKQIGYSLYPKLSVDDIVQAIFELKNKPLGAGDMQAVNNNEHKYIYYRHQNYNDNKPSDVKDVAKEIIFFHNTLAKSLIDLLC